MPLGQPWLSKPIKQTDTKIKPDWEKEFVLFMHEHGFSERDSIIYTILDKFRSVLAKQEEQHKAEMEKTNNNSYLSGLYTSENQNKKHVEKLKQQHRKELERTEKAFGGCTKCYGKGYSTYREGYQSEPDFIGDKQSKPIMQTHYIPCTCDRGKQITNLLEQKGK